MASDLILENSMLQIRTDFPEVKIISPSQVRYYDNCFSSDRRSGNGSWESFTAIMIHGDFQCLRDECGEVWSSKQLQVDLKVNIARSQADFRTSL